MKIQFPTKQEATQFVLGFATALNDGQYSDDLAQEMAGEVSPAATGTWFVIDTDSITQEFNAWKENMR